MSGDLAAGQMVAGRYRLERCIGRGGMGVVWAATHAVTRREYALKVLIEGPGSEDGRRRFEREARAATAVRHPNVIVVHDVLALDDGTPVMVMDLLEGESLAQRLAREAVLPVETFARLMLPVVSALGAAHAAGIVHRDLKPANIFLASGPDGTVDVKVLDFGIAKLTAKEGDAAASAALTNTGTILGTPSYMAPEQVLGESDIDHRADVWALGCIFYEALAGQRPTNAETVGKVLRIILTGSITPIREIAPSLPDDLASLVTRMLSFSRENRPEDLREVLEVLRAHTSVQVPTFGGANRPPPELESFARNEVPAAPGTPQLAATVAETPGAAGPRTLRRGRARRALVLASSAVIALALGALAAAKLHASAASSSGPRAAIHVAPSGRCPQGMVEIAGGTFHMGAEDGKDEERPVHEVTLPTFCLAVTEVTVRDYSACVATGSCTPASRTVYWAGIDAETIKNGFCDAYENDFQNAPVNCVTWQQADRYCHARDARLPTEAEWEFAARNGPAEDPWPWGRAPLTPSRANLCDDKCAAANAANGSPQDPMLAGSDGVTFTATVGSYPAGASKAGVLDLVGNVWEWTASPFCRYPDRDCEAQEKVFRGGGWATTLPLDARPTTRLDGAPDHRYGDVGFRCARDVP